MNRPHKIVVFDLDETLGNFVELGMFCDALENFTKRNISEKQFFKVLELFHECLRPDIIKILEYLKKKKKNGDCEKIMIYTNNQGPRGWTENISKYFDLKLNTKLFDNIVAAFKVGGKRVELGRTSHDKSVKDLVNCTKIPVDTKICFLDDQYHPYMKHNNVYYINIKPYVYEFSFVEMATRYYNSHIESIDASVSLEDFTTFIVKYMNSYDCNPMKKKTDEELNMDKIISKKILVYLKDFFNDKPTKTRRNVVTSSHNVTKRRK